MKTPLRQTYVFPGRYIATDEPYQIDWSSLMETNETVSEVDLTVLQGDTIVDRSTTAANLTTFWLSGGGLLTGAVHILRAIVQTSFDETDEIIISIPILG